VPMVPPTPMKTIRPLAIPERSVYLTPGA